MTSVPSSASKFESSKASDLIVAHAFRRDVESDASDSRCTCLRIIASVASIEESARASGNSSFLFCDLGVRYVPLLFRSFRLGTQSTSHGRKVRRTLRWAPRHPLTRKGALQAAYQKWDEATSQGDITDEKFVVLLQTCAPVLHARVTAADTGLQAARVLQSQFRTMRYTDSG